METNEARKVAKRALEKLVKIRGVDARFPLDAIWEYASTEIPSTMRPPLGNALVNDGYLEVTGKITMAESGPRAKSPTREYRPGPHFLEAPSSVVHESNTRTNVSQLLVGAAEALGDEGLIINATDLANFYLALKASPLLILTGLTGTGKSWLPRLFTKLVGAQFSAISVKPDWADNSDLFGFVPSLSPRSFVEGKFTSALKSAREHPKQLHLILLDEMNLAPVEHYFSDFLSVLPTRRRENGQLVTDRLPIDLPPRTGGVDEYAIERDLMLFPHVRVVGTANLDETTRQFSPKVLDRAFSIEFSNVDLQAFADSRHVGDRVKLAELASRIIDVDNPVSVQEGIKTQRELFLGVAALLEQIRNLLAEGRIGVTYRTRDQILLYLWHWSHDGLAPVLSLSKAFDYCVLQKIIPRIAGAGEGLDAALEKLEAWLGSAHKPIEGVTPALFPVGPFEASAARVAQLRTQLRDEGAANALAL